MTAETINYFQFPAWVIDRLNREAVPKVTYMAVSEQQVTIEPLEQPKRPGRPKGSKNKVGNGSAI